MDSTQQQISTHQLSPSKVLAATQHPAVKLHCSLAYFSISPQMLFDIVKFWQEFADVVLLLVWYLGVAWMEERTGQRSSKEAFCTGDNTPHKISRFHFIFFCFFGGLPDR